MLICGLSLWYLAGLMYAMYVLGRAGVDLRTTKPAELPKVMLIVLGIATIWPLAVYIRGRKERREIREFENIRAAELSGDNSSG